MSTAKMCKTKYLAKSAIAYSVIAAGLLLTARVIFAQETPRSITIVPPSAEYNIDPGQKQEGTLKVVNSSDTTLTFKAQVKDFVVDDTIGTPRILPDNTLSQKYSASSWIAVTPDTFTIAAGKTQTINYYLQVPSTARPGGHYAAITYTPQEILGVQGTGAGVQTQLGTLFYVHVNGNIVENATVKKFSSKGLQEYGPVTISSQITNLGDSDMKPVGSISVKNLIGQVVYTQPLEAHNIFPEASRDFTNKIGKKYMFGPYTAELNAKYGVNNNHTLYAVESFVIFPWKIVTVAILALILIILIILYLRKSRKQKKEKPVETPSTPENPQVDHP